MIVTKEWKKNSFNLSLDPSIELYDYDLDGIMYLSSIAQVRRYTHEEHLKLMSSAERIVFHNGLMHDFPLFKRMWPTWNYSSCDDTFVMSSLFNPDRPPPLGSKKPHSIEAWGLRFGMRKPEHEDWSRFTALMLHRCIEDVKICERTYEALLIESKGWDWNKSLRLEYMMASIQAQQEMNGVLFDKEKAEGLLVQIDKEMEDIEREVTMKIPPVIKPMGATVSKPFKKDGTYTKQVEDFLLNEY